MPRVATNGIEIEYDTLGDPDDPALVLVGGLGSQLLSWDDELCQGFVDRGFFVVRFDNRDSGLSTHIDAPDLDLMEAVATVLAGGEIQPPYLLTDMARDTWGLIDHLGLTGVHLLGVSLGGMIAQTMAIQDPDRVISLTSIMSTTGDPDVGHPHPEAVAVLLEPTPPDRDGAIEHEVACARAISSPDYFDEDYVRARKTLAYDRSFHPDGTVHQLLAIVSSPPRSDQLRALDLEALVVHGTIDPLVDASGGERTAECLRGSELLLIERMGHAIPHEFWAQVISAVVAVAVRGERRSAGAAGAAGAADPAGAAGAN